MDGKEHVRTGNMFCDKQDPLREVEGFSFNRMSKYKQLDTCSKILVGVTSTILVGTIVAIIVAYTMF